MKKVNPLIGRIYRLIPIRILKLFLRNKPRFNFLEGTKGYQVPSTFMHWYRQFVKGNGRIYFPVHPRSQVTIPEKVLAGIDAYPGVMPGCYIQSKEGIIIGDYTQIAPNVAIISANHDRYDTRKHVRAVPVKIGKYCWIGFGAILLPEVELGDFTIVAAGAVVTKSFPEGHCVLGGNPAKVISQLEKNKCVRYEYDKKYIGFISNELFQDFRDQYLEI